MTISPLTNQAYVTSQKSSRNGARVDHFIVHHAVSTNWRNVLDMMMGGKEVSANYIIANDGQIISVVPEEYRAWTSSSAHWDGRSITVEVCNASLNPASGYAISEAAQHSLERLIGDVGKRYGFQPSRDGLASTVLGHRDLYNWFGDSYATACPGDYTYYRLEAITKAAVLYMAGGEQLIERKRYKVSSALVFDKDRASNDGRVYTYNADIPNAPLKLIQEAELLSIQGLGVDAIGVPRASFQQMMRDRGIYSGNSYGRLIAYSTASRDAQMKADKVNDPSAYINYDGYLVFRPN